MNTNAKNTQEAGSVDHPDDREDAQILWSGRGTELIEQGGLNGRAVGKQVVEAVFVDVSGRRGRRVRRLGWFVGMACACYAVALAGVLIDGESGAPWLRLPVAIQNKAVGPSKVRPVPAPGSPGPSEQGADSGDDVLAGALPVETFSPDGTGDTPNPGQEVAGAGTSGGSVPNPAHSARAVPAPGAGGMVRYPTPAPEETDRPTAEPTAEPTVEPTAEPTAEPTGQSPDPSTPSPTGSSGEPSEETTPPEA